MNTRLRKAIVITCVSLSAILVFDALNAPDALLRFIAAGHIPGTSIYLDASVMLALFMTGLGYLTGRLTTRATRYIQTKFTRPLRRQTI